MLRNNLKTWKKRAIYAEITLVVNIFVICILCADKNFSKEYGFIFILVLLPYFIWNLISSLGE